MTLYRTTETRVVTIDDTPVTLDPAEVYDSDDPEHAAILKRFGAYFVALADVEAATAAPGERRSTRRK